MLHYYLCYKQDIELVLKTSQLLYQLSLFRRCKIEF